MFAANSNCGEGSFILHLGSLHLEYFAPPHLTFGIGFELGKSF